MQPSGCASSWTAILGAAQSLSPRNRQYLRNPSTRRGCRRKTGSTGTQRWPDWTGNPDLLSACASEQPFLDAPTRILPGIGRASLTEVGALIALLAIERRFSSP